MSRFHFKQFSLAHDESTIKVGTDAVLLGSWAQVSETENILDIGCGCGIISLMVAQNSKAHILGIDIDAASINESKENAYLSPWKERIDFRCISLQSFLQNTNQNFDCIISNPPFFENSLKPHLHKKNIGKHTECLNLKELCFAASRLLTQNGTLYTILPFSTFHTFIKICENEALFPSKICHVKSFPDKSPHRIMSGMKKEKAFYSIESLDIRENKDHYSKDYIRLTKKFYLTIQ